jgi:hypothetical protein
MHRTRIGSLHEPGAETSEDGRFHFHVEISHPFTGLIVCYRGWLTPIQPCSTAYNAQQFEIPAAIGDIAVENPRAVFAPLAVSLNTL